MAQAYKIATVVVVHTYRYCRCEWCRTYSVHAAIRPSGFAVNLDLLLSHPEARIDLNAARGYLESSLLEGLVTMDELEPKGEDCFKVHIQDTNLKCVENDIPVCVIVARLAFASSCSPLTTMYSLPTSSQAFSAK